MHWDNGELQFMELFEPDMYMEPLSQIIEQEDATLHLCPQKTDKAPCLTEKHLKVNSLGSNSYDSVHSLNTQKERVSVRSTNVMYSGFSKSQNKNDNNMYVCKRNDAICNAIFKGRVYKVNLIKSQCEPNILDLLSSQQYRMMQYTY